MRRVKEIITWLFRRSRPALAPVRATFAPAKKRMVKKNRPPRGRTFTERCALATLHQPRLTVPQACALAGLKMPETAAEIADTYMVLLTLGIEHEGTGRTDWLDAMMVGAPKERA